MSVWWQEPFAAFDSETTGVDTATDRVVTASMVLVRPEQRPTIRTWLADPGTEIPAEATAVHGVTTAHARANGQPAAEVLDVVAADVALALTHHIPVCGFNISYDLTLLEHELRRHNLPTLEDRLGPGGIRPVVDAHVLDKHIDPYRKGSRKLADTCAHYKVLLGGAHEASADALAAARLAVVVVKAHAGLSSMSAGELHDAQVAWRREQAASLERYLRKKDPTAHVDRCWPVCREALDRAGVPA